VCLISKKLKDMRREVCEEAVVSVGLRDEVFKLSKEPEELRKELANARAETARERVQRPREVEQYELHIELLQNPPA
jgi:predicted RNase H-like nuclease (RuvC/YqgF family)